jgi:hypothetical protein
VDQEVEGSNPSARPSVSIRYSPSAGFSFSVYAARLREEVVAPALPTRAEFTIIGKPELFRLNGRIKKTSSHAARGVIYAEAGLLDDAERELRAHLAINPTDERAKKLLATVLCWRELR